MFDDDVMGYCPKCDEKVLWLPRTSIGYVTWVCAKCGSILDSYVEDTDEYGE